MLKKSRAGINLDYIEAIDYIHGLTRFGMKLGLERMRFIMNALQRPELLFHSVHVGGTNGKGSTIAFLEAIALAAGLKVARYTSPHLSSYTERFTINRLPISQQKLAKLVAEMRPVFKKAANQPEFGCPTEFEVGTALAFRYFAEENVDIALIEVGLGGRLDATNILKPVVVGLTHIDHDHQEYLGEDLASIAWEKAGIIKRGTPVISAESHLEVEKVLRQRARQQKAPLFYVGQEISYRLVNWGFEGTDVELGWENVPAQYRLNLLGAHQGQNAAVAFGLAMALRERGFNIADSAIKCGLAQASWPGRLEFIPGRPDVLLDGGHNPDGFSSLSKSIKRLFPERRIVGLIGIMGNRPVEDMAAIIAPSIHDVVVTEVPDTKFHAAKRIKEAFTQLGYKPKLCSSSTEAFKMSIEMARKNNALLLVAGSLYLVGKLRPRIIEECKLKHD
jgi:dihydrofolate synthase/folylpolyglutamate synthase